MLKTYRDFVFWFYLELWIGTVLSVLFFTANIELSYTVNYVFIFVFAIIVLVKQTNKRFNDWLSTPLKNKTK